MKNSSILKISFILIFVLIIYSYKAAAYVLYISNAGNENNSGNITSPLSSLEGARDKIRSLDIAGQEPIFVFLRNGTYNLSSPVLFESEDSGTMQNPVTYMGYPGETAILSGGIGLTGWENGTVNGMPAWQTTLPSNVSIPRQLWVNNVRATRARTTVTGWNETETGFTTETPLNITHPEDIEVVLLGKGGWNEDRCKISSVEDNQIIMENPCWNIACALPWANVSEPSWIENAPEFLTLPGEWYADPRTRIITYLPIPGENIDTSQTIIPVLEHIMIISGTADDPVKHIGFDNIRFSFSSWNNVTTGPSSSSGFTEVQANIHFGDELINNESQYDIGEYPTGAIATSYTDHISFSRLIISNGGGSGIESLIGDKNLIISSSVFNDLSSTAIAIGPYNDGRDLNQANWEINITIHDNYISEIGQEYHGAPGIVAWYNQYLNITHNTLFQLPYSGISVGWGYGDYDPTFAGNNYVGENLIMNHMQHMYDGGGVYTLGAQPGTIIEKNAILYQDHVYGGIYPDSGSRYILYRENVVFTNSSVARSVLSNGGGNSYLGNYWLNRSGHQDVFLLSVLYPEIITCSVNFTKDSCGPDNMSDNNVIGSLAEVPSEILSNSGVACENRNNLSESALNLSFDRSCTLSSIMGDVNSDRKVTYADMGILAVYFETAADLVSVVDMNNDSSVDLKDLVLLAENIEK